MFKSLFCLSVVPLLFFVSGTNLHAQNLYLNEIMSSNSSTMVDEDGDSEDWIEIYYTGESPLNLEGYGLSDDDSRPFRWIFPDISIQSGEFLLVWASGKNRRNPGNQLHTNFSISSDGEEIIITSPDSIRIDELAPTEIQTDVSIGRYPDGTGDLVFFTEPTPGASNSADFFSDQLSTPAFSHEAGYHPGGLVLEIHHPENNVDIRYTLDGSEPSKSSNRYNGPIDLTYQHENSLMFIQTTPDEGADRGYQWIQPPNNIPGAYVVRAKAFKTGYVSSEISSRTFINRETEHDLPVISISTDQENLFGSSKGIYVPGDIYKELGWPPNDYWGRPNANYHQRGIEWERPAGFELIEKDGTHHTQNIGVRIHGGGSRALPQKSLRLYARSSYGDSRFDYDLFETGESGYNRLILRNSGQDFYSRATMFIDAFMHSLVSDLSFDTMDYRPFAVYINGEYWGIKNLRERYDKHYLGRKYNVPGDQIDLLSNNAEVKEGSSVFYNTILDSLEQNHIDELGGMEFIERHIDVQNFTEYYASQIYFSNVDWPGQNIDYWRYTGPPEARGRARDGRFRWLMFDLDFGMGYLSESQYDSDIFDHLLTDVQTTWANHPRTTLMFRSFINNRDFLEYYVNTQMDLLNSYVSRDHAKTVLSEFKDRLSGEINSHIERWGYPANYNSWENHITYRADYIDNRQSHLIHHLQSRFGVGETATIIVDNPDQQKGTVQVNNLKLTEGIPGSNPQLFPWTGEYFINIPVLLTALPEHGYQIKNWEVDGELKAGRQIRVTPKDSLLISVNFEEIPDPADEGKILLYYWHFDTDVPNDVPLEFLPATFTSTGYEGTLRYQAAVSPYPPPENFGDEGILDRVNDPTPVNYRSEGNFNHSYNEDEMRGIRARNPSVVVRDGEVHESALIFDLPTTEYESLVITFAARRTDSGQEKMVFHYSVNEGNPVWIQDRLPVKISETPHEYGIFNFDFSRIEGHAHNPHFKFRISFEGDNLSRDSGNTRFNNIAIYGSRFSGTRVEDIMESKLHPNYPNPFSEYTNIKYQINQESDVSVDLYSITGQRVQRLVNEPKERGNYTVRLDATGLASGVYILRLKTDDHVDFQKITFIK